MGSVLHDYVAERGGRWSQLFGALQDAHGAPFGVATMCRWHVIGNRHVAVSPRIAGMTCHALPPVENRDDGAGYTDIDLLPDQAGRHRIPAAVDLDVVVRRDAGALPPGEDIWISGKRLQVRTVQRGKQISTAGAVVPHHSRVQVVQKGRIAVFSSASEKNR